MITKQYLLPRLSAPRPEMPKKVKSTAAPGSSKSINVRLKSARNPSFEFSVSNTPISTKMSENKSEKEVKNLSEIKTGSIARLVINPGRYDPNTTPYQFVTLTSGRRSPPT